MNWIEPNVLAAIVTGLFALVGMISLLGNEGFRNAERWDESSKGESK